MGINILRAMCRITECVFTGNVTSQSPSRTCHIWDLSVEMLFVEIISMHLNWQVSSLKLILTAYNTYLINTNNFFSCKVFQLWMKIVLTSLQENNFASGIRQSVWTASGYDSISELTMTLGNYQTYCSGFMILTSQKTFSLKSFSLLMYITSHHVG